MNTLAQQQSALLGALFTWPADAAVQLLAGHADLTNARGLQVYQANGHMLAERALTAAYPVLAQLIGADSFAQLARALWHAAPPERGDVAQWGGAMAGFLSASEQLSDEPYLPDVARTEWALHRCAVQADATADLASIALLTTEDPDTLQLTLSSGCAAIRSQWPLASIIATHSNTESPDWAALTQRMRAQVAEDVIVWREGLRPRVREAQPGESDLLQALLGGHTLGQALDVAASLDFGAWLPLAVRTGLVLGVVQQAESGA
ncbi:DNA-binding domain-containing protein [Rhodoferax aquaticus]|uniref:Putative DNA-binding domain-containing protein n=1 Tax=Rhodoferax aquaticus TaxID=2527691 RepID=A0A515EVB9_9BURK|nr:DNA-binding domain-containing protein [Rhodoferax aquaticus]QDL56569.1 hypothetical protein EXZ61_21760 [Rhodoferax aquaticus]